MRRNIIPLLAMLSLCGCSVTQQLSIGAADGAHTSTSFVNAQEVFSDVVADFDTFNDSGESEISLDELMDEIAESFYMGREIGDLELIKTGKRSYMLFFTFQDVETLMADLGSDPDQDILTLKDHTLSLHLSIDNYHELEKIVPLLSSDNFQPFGPVYNQGISEEDYLEMLGFMLGDEIPEAVKESTITLQIETPEPIQALQHMDKESACKASLTFPLIDLLLLQNPIDASISW